ncbi:MAG: putative tRNA-dihydrouridine synthase [Myxococcota bacterium]|nr:putative tRNA-dihydrouridine synthase [Myxococcota bacterium]
MKIGDVNITNPTTLAPMAGCTSVPFRLICREWGAGMVYTEMVSSVGLHRSSGKTMEYLRTDPAEEHVGMQLFGNDGAALETAAGVLERMGAAVVDINMGCPVRKITSLGCGSALLRNPAEAARVVSAVKRGTRRPVTVKIRTGWDSASINAWEVAKAVEDAGAAAVTVHGRTRAQGYEGQANWDIIARVKQAVKIPVIGNGDITTPEHVRRIYEQTGCDGVMIGRGSLGNPFIFAVINRAYGLPHRPWPPTLSAVLETIQRHLDLAVDHDHGDEKRAMVKMRKHVLWYTKGLRGGADVRRSLNTVSTREQAMNLIADAFHKGYTPERYENWEGFPEIREG